MPQWIDIAMILSGPSSYDSYILPMTLDFIYRKNNCINQREELKKRTDKAVPILLKSLNDSCNIISTTPKYQNTDIISYRCQCNNFYPIVNTLLHATCAYKNGIMPHDGGYLDQSAIVMSLLDITSGFLTEKEKQELEEQKKRQPANKRR